MKHEREKESAHDGHTGLERREFLAILAGFTAGLMMPRFLHGQDFTATTARSDRLGTLLPWGQKTHPRLE